MEVDSHRSQKSYKPKMCLISKAKHKEHKWSHRGLKYDQSLELVPEAKRQRQTPTTFKGVADPRHAYWQGRTWEA